MIHKIRFALFLGFAFCFSINAQNLFQDPVFVQEVKLGVDAAYNMEPEKVAQIANQIEQKYDNHPVSSLLRGVVQWWNILVDLDNRSSDAAFHREMNEAIRRANRLGKNTFDAALIRATVNGLKSRLYSNRSSWMNAFRHGRRAVDDLTEVAKIAPESSDYALGWGLYDYFSVTLAERYKAVSFLMKFFPDGSKERGIAELEKTMQDGVLMQPEAAYWLFQIYYSYDSDYGKATYYINWLRNKYPNNAFYLLLQARLLEQGGRSSESQVLFKQLLEKYETQQSGYATAAAEQSYYYTARQAYFDKEWQKAYDGFKKGVTIGETQREKSRFLTLNYFFLGRVADVLGNREEALGYYRRCLALDNVGTTHERVKEHLQTPFKD